MDIDHLTAYAAAGVFTKQGRLGPPLDGHYQAFPRATWEQELAMLGRLPGIRGIEWMYDLYGLGANPLESESGRQWLNVCLAQAGLKLHSVCADYFMDCPLVRCTSAQRKQRCERLAWLIDVCPQVGIRRIVLPLLDAASIRTPQERATVVDCLLQILPLAQKRGVHLSLESDLAPQPFRELLLEFDHPMVGVNYDTGNSAAAGFDPREEFATYGAWIVSVHVKDRRRGAATVPLGEGDADFPLLRELLQQIDYRGDFVMEAARGEPGQEPAWQTCMAARTANWLRGGALINERLS